MNEFQATALPHELLCRVENLLPDVCHLCNQSYCIKLSDKPIVSCVQCGQGCHNQCVLQLLNMTEDDLNEGNEFGKAILNPYAALGLVYMCGICQKEVLPQKDALKIKSSRTRTSDQIQSVNSDLPTNTTSQAPPDGAAGGSGTPPQTTASTDPVESAQQANITHTAIQDDQAQITLTENRGGRASTNQRRNRTATTPLASNNGDTNAQAQVCWFYKQGRCKHGISGRKDGLCNHAHPKPCKNFITNGDRGQRGCKKGGQCQFFHPKVCNTSLNERLCTNADCKYLHIRGTKRSTQPVANPQQAESTGRQTRLSQSQGSSSAARVTQQNPTNSTVLAPFLEQLKLMSDQMQFFSTKLLQLDQRFSTLQQATPLPMFRPPNLQFLPQIPQLQHYHPPAAPLGQQPLGLQPQPM